MQWWKTEESKKKFKRIENLGNILSTSWSPFPAYYMSFRSLGSQKSNASNGARIGVETKKLWPFEDNHAKLSEFRCETPLWHTSSISQLHPLISQLRNGLQNGLKKYSLATKWPRNHHFATKSPPSYDSSCKSSSSCGITSKLQNQSSNLQNG